MRKNNQVAVKNEKSEVKHNKKTKKKNNQTRAIITCQQGDKCQLTAMIQSFCCNRWMLHTFLHVLIHEAFTFAYVEVFKIPLKQLLNISTQSKQICLLTKETMC